MRLHSRSGLAIFDRDNPTKSVADGNFDPLQRCADHPVPAAEATAR
jgi:hypothetical protein